MRSDQTLGALRDIKDNIYQLVRDDLLWVTVQESLMSLQIAVEQELARLGG